MIKKPYLLYMLLLPALMAGFASSCEQEPPKLNREHKAQIDTLVKHQTLHIREEVDSLCKVDFDKKVQEVVDSLVKVRIEEINRQFR